MSTGKGKRGVGRAAAWLVVLAVSFGLAGCGNGEDAEGGTPGNPGVETPGNSAQGNAVDEEKVMGRYLEQADDSLAGVFPVKKQIVQAADGSLAILAGGKGKWVSKDNGATWEQEPMTWHEELLEEGVWVMDMAMAQDGTMAVIYEPADDGAPEKGAETDAGNGEDPAGDAENGETAEESREGDGGKEESGEGEELHIEDFAIYPHYGVIAPDGTFREVEIPYKDQEYVKHIIFSEDGRLFGAAFDGRVYEVDVETGASRVVVEMPYMVQYMDEKDGRLLLAGEGGVKIIELASGEAVEDEVLDDFIREQMGDIIHYSMADTQSLLLLPGEEGILYLVFEKGIYRHVIGGNVIEQVVDGSLTSLGDPSCRISDGILLENDEFLLLTGSGSLLRYVYNPDTPAVPEIRLTAYSLWENPQMKTVISAYQAKHPEVYIKYNVGIEKEGAATREDALKKLNAEIAAGNGPDLFLLDDMPMDSYIDKGVLMDLTPYLEDKTADQYFTNVLYAFRKLEGTFVVPAQFQTAMLVGKKDEIAKMTDLEAIAETAEAYGEENPGVSLFGARAEEELLNILIPVCAPAWKNEEGALDKAALIEFYTAAKRIWDVEKEGIEEEEKESYEQWIADMEAYGISGEDMKKYQFSVGEKIWDYLSGSQEFAAGTIDGSFDFDVTVSCFRIKGKTDGGFTLYQGQAESVFLPDSLVGISSTTEHREIAAELLEDFLEDDGWDGMPVNKEKCREGFHMNATEDGSSYGTMGTTTEEGNGYLSLDIYPASEEEIELLMKLAEEGKTPYVRDSVLEDAVFEAGVKVLAGKLDASAAAEETVQKTAIYLSE